MTTVTVVQQPAQTVTVSQAEKQAAYVYKAGIFKVTQPAVGAVDGVNRVFKTNVPFEPGSIEVYINGLKEHRFSLLTEMAIELENAPKNNGFADYIELIYLTK